MKDTFYKAQYILALSENKMTDEIRKNYAGSFVLSSAEDGYIVINQIMMACLQSTSYTADEFKNQIKLEYNELGLSKVLGDYSKYSPVLNLMIDIHNTDYLHSELINLCKECVDFAEKQADEIKICIYNGVLKTIVGRGLVLEDVPFTKMVSDYVEKNLTLDQNTNLTGIVGTVLGNASCKAFAK